MKSISRRDFLKLGGLSLLSGSFLHFESIIPPYQKQFIFSHGSTHYNCVALTYDDCYLVTMLHRLEDILAGHPEVRVTLFPVGETLLNNERKDPGVWKRFVDKGHEIGYHSFDHTNPEVLSQQKLEADFDRWIEALRAVLETQTVVHFARPPFGNTSPSFLNMCAQRGLMPTMWSKSWSGPTQSVTTSIVPKIRRGDIVLMHTRLEDIDTTANALPELAKRGIQAVTLRRLYLDWLEEQNESQDCYDNFKYRGRTCIK